MIKRFPSRNHRSKGIKVKHVLQIILLLGVCFWLIYQVKHNHDKKKEFDKKDAKLSVSAETNQILKLGRRDLHPVKHDHTKPEEEEEDEHIEEDEENKHGQEEQEDGSRHETEEHEDNKHDSGEQGEEENKHGAEEQEEDENKNEDMEDEGRGGGDDEIDENDQEKPQVDTTDRDDEFLDEEKEKEVDEKEDEDKEGLVENHNNHEAREEHYKGDDASSAVAHDTHATSTETETLSLENSDVNMEMNITKPENEATYSDESVRNQNDSGLKVSEGDTIDRISSNVTTEVTGNNTLFNPVDDSPNLNKKATINSDNHLEVTSNLTVTTTEASNNETGAGKDTSSLSEQNKTVMSESDQAQNTTKNTTIPGDVKNVQTDGLEQSGDRISEENLHNTNLTVKTENGEAASGESSNLEGGELEKTNRFVASNGTENTYTNERSDTSEGDKSKGNTEKNETQNVDGTEDEMFKGDIQTGETDETSDSFSANETLDSAEQDAIDSSDTHIHEDVTEARTDLDTLPDIRNEGDDSDETVAE
ncbi:myb-like protein X [Cajanus cajan]|uniref:myb-like protein X n=1 Tax=Cajanus cajan TaxID=3821 RepID=UPI00098D8B29|nr:myb-like protein X [Cajanus cajan]